MTEGLAGKVVVVTGASRGIGEAIAREFATLGAHVAALARSESDLKETVNSFPQEAPDSLTIPCDVSDAAAVDSAVSTVLERFDRIDVLVNCAGTRQSFATVDKLPLETWREVVDGNLTSVFLMSQAVGRSMIEAGTGCIVNIGSIAGHVGMERIGAYCAAKAGVTALTQVMALEWAPLGIRVNAVAPGWVESPMNFELRTQPQNKPKLEQIISKIPARRFGDADEIAHACAYLASPRAGYVTGTTLFVDGGWCAV